MWRAKEIQNSNGKWQMENHLRFAICRLICSFGLQEPGGGGG
jgi:hypothetical protein